MRVSHSIPAREPRRHERTLDCPCGPHQSVTAAPGEQPSVLVTHRPLPRRKP